MARVRRATIAAAAVTAAALGLTAAPASAVVGGHPVDAARYPWLAAVGTPAFFVRPSGQFCGGALIAPDRVVTAAHCVSFAPSLPQAFTVTFDRSDLWAGGGTTVGVRSIWIDPHFHETQFQGDTDEHDDLAVLTLTRPLRRPTVALTAPHGRTATVLGWGATSADDYLNPRLNAAEVPLVPNRVCAAAYGPSFEPASMMCAGSPRADTGTFDSGGPLLVDGKLAAITSWASGTARPGYPGVYALLSSLPPA